jgi:ribose transport system substrate-binding protein
MVTLIAGALVATSVACSGTNNDSAGGGTSAPASGQAPDASQAQASQDTPSDKELVFGYISPGPDTWYKRDVEGFRFAADKYGVKVVELNSQYDQQKEIENIQSLVGQAVDGISMFSFNENGAVMAAQEGAKAGIPVVLTDDVGAAVKSGATVAAAVDFDWCGMGEAYAEHMAEQWPGENFAILAGNYEAPPTKLLDECMLNKAEELGKNKNVFMQPTMYSIETAVNLAQSLIASGTEFGILFVMDDDMGAAVAELLKSEGLADKVHLMTQNGSDVGLQMLKDGSLEYTISSSPGWEGSVAFLALYAAATGKIPADGNKQIELPVVPIDASSDLDNAEVVVPWEPNEVYWTLNDKHFADLVPAE